MALFKQVKNIGYNIKIKPEFEKLPLKKLFISSAIISASTIIVGVLAQIILPPEIPLNYGLPQTSDQLSKAIYIVIPSLVSLFLTAFNIFVSIKLADSYLKKTLAFTSLSVSILSFITTYKIIFLVSTL